MGLALSNFVHRSDQAMIQKKLGDFATQGNRLSSSGNYVNDLVCVVALICYYFDFGILNKCGLNSTLVQ